MTRVGCLQKVWLANSYHRSRIITCDLAVPYLVSSNEMSCLITPWQALGVVNPVDRPGTCGDGKAGHRVTSCYISLGNSHGVGVCSISSAWAELGALDAGVPFIVQDQQKASDVVILAPPARHPRVSAQGHEPVEVVRAYTALIGRQLVPGLAPQSARRELQVATSASRWQQHAAVMCAVRGADLVFPTYISSIGRQVADSTRLLFPEHVTWSSLAILAGQA